MPLPSRESLSEAARLLSRELSTEITITQDQNTASYSVTARRGDRQATTQIDHTIARASETQRIQILVRAARSAVASLDDGLTAAVERLAEVLYRRGVTVQRIVCTGAVEPSQTIPTMSGMVAIEDGNDRRIPYPMRFMQSIGSSELTFAIPRREDFYPLIPAPVTTTLVFKGTKSLYQHLESPEELGLGNAEPREQAGTGNLWAALREAS